MYHIIILQGNISLMVVMMIATYLQVLPNEAVVDDDEYI